MLQNVIQPFYADISFVGINSKGKIEIVSLEPKEEYCTLPNFPVKSKNVFMKDLDESNYLYDGNLGIYTLENKEGQPFWRHVTDLQKKLPRQGNKD